MTAIKRIHLNQCCGILIDVQDGFLAPLTTHERDRIEINMRGFTELLTYLKVPVLATLERPVDKKGSMPEALARALDAHDLAESFEKDFFDLTKHREITAYLRSLKKRQALIAGAETDVCVLQSCLGLLDAGYEVFLIEDLLFTATGPEAPRAAIDRMCSAGAVLTSLKSIYYELLGAGEASPERQRLIEKFGPLPMSNP